MIHDDPSPALYRLYESADGWIFLAAPRQRDADGLKEDLPLGSGSLRDLVSKSVPRGRLAPRPRVEAVGHLGGVRSSLTRADACPGG